MAAARAKRVVFVGVGGASCSGKTTLINYLYQVLPNSFLIHQDDFCTPGELAPVHPVYNIQDWDAAPTAILWPKFIEFLKQVKDTARLPPDHHSHDHWHTNGQDPVDVDVNLIDKWVETFKLLENATQSNSDHIVWGLVDGFLLYWHPQVVELLDVRIFLRTPASILKKRRQARDCYSDPDGTSFRDPPGYWDKILYPAFLDAHRSLFVDGDIEEGEPGLLVRDLVVLNTTTMPMNKLLDQSYSILKIFWERML